MKIDIKKATIAELDEVAFLFNAYRVWYHQSSDIKSATVFLRDRLMKNESTVFIGIIENKVVGFVQLYAIFSSIGLKPAWLLNDLFVAEGARKQGVAKALLEAARNFGTEKGARFLLLQTSCDNYNAQSLYESNGWVKQTDYFYELPLMG